MYNRGESAYNSLALFTFPSYVQYVQVTNSDIVECSLDNSENKEMVKCSLGNQIPKDRYVNFTMEFTTAGHLQDIISINASVKTKSEEKNLLDNTDASKIPMRMKAEITFNG